MSRLFVAASGGADSTAMLLGLHEHGEKFEILFTPTGNELPGVQEHLQRLADHTGSKIIVPKGPSLQELIDAFQALPNHRQRWCTRMIKIQPCIAFLKQNPGNILCVGLRADEPERTGMYGDYATYRYPLREWNWNRPKVEAFNFLKGFSPPKRTDCALCYAQQNREWYELWRDHPDMFQHGVLLEEQTGATFRSPTGKHGTWPVALKDMGAQFSSGRIPKERARRNRSLGIINTCRVCHD